MTKINEMQKAKMANIFSTFLEKAKNLQESQHVNAANTCNKISPKIPPP